MIGWLLVLSGAVVALVQVFSPSPWQAGFTLGVVLFVVGIVRLSDRSSEFTD